MKFMLTTKINQLQTKLCDAAIDTALITDEDTIYYLTGYYDYLHMDFGRPTILVIPQQGNSLLITPTIDLTLAQSLAQVDRIAPWNDGDGNEWRQELPAAVGNARSVGIEANRMPPMVQTYVNHLLSTDKICDVTDIIADMRMIKTTAELQLARHAGQVAMAMMQAGKDAIGDGVAEYEVALATSQAGTRKAADILNTHYKNTTMSPNTHFLQIMASGKEIVKTHHRASTRIMKRGEPVFLCFCGMTNFHRFKLGFDRTFWIGEIADKTQADLYNIAVKSQQAALAVLAPGVTAESVHAAYAQTIQSAGHDYPFRCGRATGFSFLEKPQLVTGDKTILQPGMVFAVDGSVATKTFRAQVGDSFIITEQGYEPITNYPKNLEAMII